MPRSSSVNLSHTSLGRCGSKRIHSKACKQMRMSFPWDMKLILFVLKNKEEGVEKKEGEGAARKPIRETFFGSAGIRVSSQTASPLAPWGRCRARRLPPQQRDFTKHLCD